MYGRLQLMDYIMWIPWERRFLLSNISCAPTYMSIQQEKKKVIKKQEPQQLNS